MQEERRGAMTLSQASFPNPWASGPLQFHAPAARVQGASSRSRLWPQQCSSHILPSHEGGIDTGFRTRSGPTGAALLGGRLSCQHRPSALQPIRDNSLGESWSAKSIATYANPPSRPYCSLSRKRSMAFCPSNPSYRRPLLLAVSLQTTRCFLKQGL